MDNRKCKRVYWATVAASFATITAGSLWLTLIPNGWVGRAVFAAVAYWIAARTGAWTCRRLGVALDQSTVEEIRAPQGGGTSIGARVTVRRWPLASFATTGAVLLVLLRQYSELGFAPPVLAWAGLFAIRLRESASDVRTSAEATDAGLLERQGLEQARTIPWEQISTCTLETRRDVLGKPVGAAVTFLDADGDELTTIILAGVPRSERERFLEAVRAKMGASAERPELISAEAPAGTGTELLAGRAAEGRGTEMERAPERHPV